MNTFTKVSTRRSALLFLINPKLNTTSAAKGFTLVELLVVVAALPILILLVSQLFISQVSIERKLLASQSAENLRSRLSFLLESDVADGRKVVESQDAAEQLICPSEPSQIFTVFAPYLSSAGTLTDACIYYTLINGQLIRKGPSILQNGSLKYSEITTQSVVTGIQISELSVNSTDTKISMNLFLSGYLGSPGKQFNVAYGTKNLRVGS